MTSRAEIERRFIHLSFYGMALALVGITTNFLPLDDGPWLWAKGVVLAIGTIVFIVWGTRLVLWQRDEYWRERGKDPKHPERPGRVDGP